MTLIQALILGIVQGLTEFLPISSSAHLVLVPFLFGWHIPQEHIFPFDVLVQLGTLLAVIVYFWKDLWQIITMFIAGLLQRRPFEKLESRLGWYIILATIPAGLAGLFIKHLVEDAFQSPLVTGIFLLVTAALLLLAEIVSKRQRSLQQMTWKDALWMGCAQMLSIFPGVSRSGATIAGGMIGNLDRPAAARFSFLMSIPIMLAAGLLSTLDLLEMPGLAGFLPVIAAGFFAAAVVGYLSIHWLLSFLNRHSLLYFSAYCTLAGIVTLLIYALR